MNDLKMIEPCYLLVAGKNLDHNPTSQSPFHGTGISLSQFSMKDNPGEKMSPIILTSSESISPTVFVLLL